MRRLSGATSLPKSFSHNRLRERGARRRNPFCPNHLHKSLQQVSCRPGKAVAFLHEKKKCFIAIKDLYTGRTVWYTLIMKEKKPLGLIFYETADIVCIATGFGKPSDNTKTGAMVQTWILVKECKPTEALKRGLDLLICGNCIHRGNGSGKKRTCYVNLGQGPRAVWDAWKRGRYARLNDKNINMFTGRKLRVGSYGDPYYVPSSIWVKLLRYAENDHTGYTHQWREAPHLKNICMASVDTFEDAMEAWAKGWRTFRMGFDKQDNEVTCPASEEGGRKTTCEKCALCAGASKIAKSVIIQPHGTGKKHFAGK